MTIMGLVTEIGSEGSSEARLADSRGAIEKNEFTLGEKVGDQPGLLSRWLLELKGTGHGMLHIKNGLWAWYACTVISGKG